MEYVFKDLSTRSIVAWLAIVISGLCLADLGFHSHVWAGERPLLAMLAWLGVMLFFGRAIYRAAQMGPSHLLTVCIWSAFLVVAAVGCAYYVFFTWPGSENPGYDKILNVVPVLAAIWAAGLGWFVHYQLTNKAHRSKNSFDILMSMRMNSEFRKRADLASRHFPPGTSIADDYVVFFPNASLKKLYDRKRGGEGIPDIDFERAEAVMALKYLLNYYEFMAVGIKKGDLDEKMLYETVSTTVVGTFQRAKRYVEHLNGDRANGGGGELLAFSYLSKLVKAWDAAYDEELAAMKRQPMS